MLPHNCQKSFSRLYLLCIDPVVAHFGVDPDNDGFDCGIVLVDQKLDHEEVDDGEAEHHAPQNGVRTGEGAVGEGQGGDDQEEEGHAAHARENVGAVIRAGRFMPATIDEPSNLAARNCANKTAFCFYR